MAEVLFTFLMQICIITTVSAIENTNDTAIQHNFKVKVTQLIEDYPHGLLDAHLAESDSNSQSSTSVPMKGLHLQLSYPQSRTKRSRFNHDNERQKLDNRIKEVDKELRHIDVEKENCHVIEIFFLLITKKAMEIVEQKEKKSFEEKQKLVESIKALERAEKDSGQAWNVEEVKRQLISLLGKCETASFLIKIMFDKPGRAAARIALKAEGVELDDSVFLGLQCKFVQMSLRRIDRDPGQVLEKNGKLECFNLQAERELLVFASVIAGKRSEGTFLQRSQDQFAKCKK